eukprot:TRINITY_DN4816_c0_g1_i1.p1 TRINITY_DN4816_c0_g1~~TRINITY_DN4816_c0_g1_i1.p1  ORF type:complete len:499 (-),score=124.05 TRINITY_DN4816_c0_g1_i1:75-1571(-)
MNFTFENDMWGGVKQVYDRFDEGKSTLRNMVKFLQERASIEEHYAKGLEKLINSKVANITEKGTVAVGWNGMKTEADNAFKQHSQLCSQMQTNVLQPLLVLKKDQSTNRATLGAEVTKLDKGLEKGKLELSRAKNKYFKLCKDHELNTANLSKAEKDPTTIKPKELIRLRTTVQTLKKDSEAAHIQYQQQIKEFQAYQKKYEESMKKILQDFQALEEKRIQKIADVQEKFYQSLESLISSLQQSVQSFRKTVEGIDYMSDVQGFISGNKTGSVPDSPVEYEPYISQLTGQPAHSQDKGVSFAAPSNAKQKSKKNPLGKLKKSKKKSVDPNVPITAPVASPKRLTKKDEDSVSNGDVPPLSQSQVSASGASMQSSASVEHPVVKAKALYDYNAADDTEITFKADDIINVTKNDDSIPGWMEGEFNGKIGLFPGNYVEILTRKRKCVALFDFVAENDDELSIKEGEELIIESEAEGWFTGTNKNGETGLFPANYVDEKAP